MAAEGQAIAKAAGSDRIVFVPYGVPGDELTVEIGETKKNFANGRILHVDKPAFDRQDPPCPYHFHPPLPGVSKVSLPPGGGQAAPVRWCGGCDWQQFGYEAALRTKREIVLDCIKRIGRLDTTVLPTLASPKQLRYRNKVQVPFGRQGNRIVAGFYQPGSHSIVDFEDCLVQPELSVAIVNRIKTLAGPGPAGFGWQPYDSRSHSGWLRHVFIRTNSAGKALVAFVTRTSAFPAEQRAVEALTAAFPQIVSIQQNVQPEQTSVILGPSWRKLWGQDTIEETIGRVKLVASPGAFLQVNTAATELLYGVAEAMLLSEGFRPSTVLDLYSGVGAIALWLAPKAGKVIGVEEVPQAVTDAIANAKRNGARNVTFIRSKSEAYFRSKYARQLPKYSAAVLDPPRAGCEPHVLRSLARSGVDRIVYVSCNPATFARDARILADHRFRLQRVQPVDLFPQTSHVELVGLFDSNS